jgi:hypothetical protein
MSKQTPRGSSLSDDGVPVIMTAPATGPQGTSVKLPIAVISQAGTPLLGDIEVSGVPDTFAVAPARRGREHAPGFYQWTVTADNLAEAHLVPVASPGSTGVFTVGVVAMAHAGDNSGTKAAMQFLDVSITPDASNLRVVVDPVQATTTIDTFGDSDYHFFHRGLGDRKAVVFQVAATNDARIGLFEGPDQNSPCYEVVVCGWGGATSAIRKDGSAQAQAYASTPDGLNPNSNPGATWRPVGGLMAQRRFTQISVNTAGAVWAVDTWGQLFYRTTSRSSWTFISGVEAKHVAVGAANSLWCVDKHDAIYVRTGTSATHAGGMAWQLVDRGLSTISVGSRGQVWGLNSDGSIWARLGITGANPAGTSWQRIDGALASVSCAGRSVWGVSSDDRIWFREGVEPGRPFGTRWRQVDGSLEQISVTGTGRVWGVWRGSVRLRTGVTASNPTGTGWHVVGPYFSQVACGALSVWGLYPDGSMWYRTRAESPTFWADAQHGHVRLGRGSVVGDDVVLEWHDPSPLDVNYVAVSTGAGSKGRWSVSLPGVVPVGAGIVNQTTEPGTRVRIVGSNPYHPEEGFVEVGGTKISRTNSRGHTLVVLDRHTLGVLSERTYDTYGSEPAGRKLASDLDRLDASVIVCVYSAGPLAVCDALVDALKRCGASAAVRKLTRESWSYALGGVPGMGENSGHEAIRGPTQRESATLDLDWHDGVFEGHSDQAWSDSQALCGRWKPGYMLISGLPTDASLTHGAKVASAADGTTMWAVPADQAEHVSVNLPSSDQPDGAVNRLNLVVETTAALELDEAMTVNADAAASANFRSGYLSDGMNLWAGVEATNGVEVNAVASLGGRVAIDFTASATQTYGASASGGAGADTNFPCPQCDGTGRVDGSRFSQTLCPRCGGSGVLTAPGARLHLYAGAAVQAKIGTSSNAQIVDNVSTSQEIGVSARAGADAVGDSELYAGNGRYGTKSSFSTFAGSSVSASAASKVDAFGSSAGGTAGVASPGSLGITGGGKAVYDNGKLTFGLSGDLGIGIAGISLGFEITIDTGPLQDLAVSVWDNYGESAATTIVNGGEDAAEWAVGAGGFIARQADGTIAWGAGAASDAADFFEHDVGGAFNSAGIETAAFFVDVGTGAIDGLAMVGQGVEDTWNATEDFFEDDVAGVVTDVGDAIGNVVTDVGDLFGL